MKTWPKIQLIFDFFPLFMTRVSFIVSLTKIFACNKQTKPTNLYLNIYQKIKLFYYYYWIATGARERKAFIWNNCECARRMMCVCLQIRNEFLNYNINRNCSIIHKWQLLANLNPIEKNCGKRTLSQKIC
jgi:hypothetical protein